ncbi:MAG: FAD-dependent oxidoreductase [Burkholderiales bacterium]|jgi:NADPH-dependent 2,4-dienoyl-CoA reductase/sulfur reductase-like enzyme/rhodanese-related sulfurtransferase|nr:FAD-dependent oxidoreductase [Burkholderiales bacterium]
MKTKKLVIVGGVAGGASAAVRARRLSESLDIVVLERGHHVSFANCGLPYHIGGDIAQREALLLHTPESLHARFALDVRVNHEAVAINRQAKTITVHDHAQQRHYEESYDSLLLAPGAAPIRPPIPGIDDPRVFTLRNVSDMDSLLAALTPDVRKAAVIGAGFIGLEMVEALHQRRLDVTLIERDSQILIPLDAEMTAPLVETLRQKQVALHLGDGLTAIERSERLQLSLASGKKIEADIVLLAIGVRPESTLAREAGLELGIGGAIVVDAQQRTSDPAIFAVGDAVQVKHVVSGQPTLLPLAGPANRQGRIAADVIVGGHAAYRGSQGTAICKLFEQTAGATGMNEKALKAAGIRYRRLFLHGNDHASYYPGATPISMKLLFSAEDGRILGAQAVGQNGVDKRLDVLAVAIQAGMTIDDLAEMELCYAPPYGSAKDLVNIAGMAAQNLASGLLSLTEPEAVASAVAAGALLVDVRQPEEVARETIPGAINVPLPQLRSLAETALPKKRPLVVYCQVGLRAYVAQRFLQQSGWSVSSLNGGYRTWRMFQTVNG